VGPCNLFYQRAEGRRCAVCADHNAEAGRALCAACTHSYDGPDLKGPGTPDIIRWAAERSRATERQRIERRSVIEGAVMGSDDFRRMNDPTAGADAAPAHEARMLRARAILVWMEHENQLAEREMVCCGAWMSDHTAALAAFDAELQALLKEG
jgi:hypothetical protein